MKIAILIAAAAVALSWAPASPAAQPRSSRSRPGLVRVSQLTITTVPRLAGVRFKLGGQTFAAGHDGVARIDLSRGVYRLEVIDRDVRQRDVRSRFSRWGDNSFTWVRTLDFHGPMQLEVGFEQSVLVDFTFVDRSGRAVDNRRVARLTLSSTIGSRESFRPGRPRWLIASSIARRFSGLEQTRIKYSLQTAVVDGSNVVQKAQLRFFPAQTRRVRVRLLLYSARLSVHDLLFGFHIGKSLDLTYPDGRRVSFPLNGRDLVLHSLPRGTYGIKVHAWGYSPVSPLALSKDQVVDLKVISYLDALVIFLLAVVATAFAILVRRLHLRAPLLPRRLRHYPNYDSFKEVHISPERPSTAESASEEPSRTAWTQTNSSSHPLSTRTPDASALPPTRAPRPFAGPAK